MNAPLILIVTPSINAKGMRATSVRGQLYDMRLQGRLTVDLSPQPSSMQLVLLSEGVDPGTQIVRRRSEDGIDALSSTVAVAAGLTVNNDGDVPALVAVRLGQTWPWPTWPKEDEIDLTHMSRKVKEGGGRVAR